MQVVRVLKERQCSAPLLRTRFELNIEVNQFMSLLLVLRSFPKARRLGSPKQCVYNVAVQPAGFFDFKHPGLLMTNTKECGLLALYHGLPRSHIVFTHTRVDSIAILTRPALTGFQSRTTMRDKPEFGYHRTFHVRFFLLQSSPLITLSSHLHSTNIRLNPLHLKYLL